MGLDIKVEQMMVGQSYICKEREIQLPRGQRCVMCGRNVKMVLTDIAPAFHAGAKLKSWFTVCLLLDLLGDISHLSQG